MNEIYFLMSHIIWLIWYESWIIDDYEKYKEPLKQQELVDYRDNPVFAFIIGAVIEARHESLNTEMVMWPIF